MADNSGAQSLVAAFAFGIVANAASAAVFLYLRAHGPPIFQDSLRLVLVIFLSSSALWAVVDFIALTIDATSGCQVAVAFGSAFDQLARVAFQQFLLWGLNGGLKVSMSDFIPQVAIILRFILGGVYVGFQRPGFNPVCVSTASVLPLGIAVLVVDAVITLFFLAKLVRSGDSQNRSGNEGEAKRSRILLLGIAGAGFWTALSAPMILGASSLNLFLRTTLPAIGLLVLITIVILCKDRFVTENDGEPKLPPIDSTPRNYRMSDFVRGSENAGATRSVSQRPPSRYADVKDEETTASFSAFNISSRNKELPKINHPDPGQSELGIGGMPVTGQLFPPMRPEESSAINDTGRTDDSSRERPKFPKKKPKISGPITISAPILNDDSLNPLDRIATVDLETAAKNEQERREAHPQPLESHSSGIRGPPSFGTTPEPTMQRSKSISDRKAVAQPPAPVVTKTHLEPILESGSASVTSSAQLSPGGEDIRRRSPRQPRNSFTRQSLPPLPPLKTPGTMNGLATPTKQQDEPDTWDLLSVPKESGTEAPVTPPPRSPLRPQASTSPAAKSIATMTQTSQPDGTGRQRRTASTSKPPRSSDMMFMDPGTPPPIPQRGAERKDFMHSQSIGTDPPPPYKSGITSVPSPQRATADRRSTQDPASTRGTQSPTKPEAKFSIFPPGYSNKASVSPPQQRFSATGSGVTPMTVPKTSDPETPNTFSQEQENHTDRTVFFLREIEYNKPLPAKIVTVPADKPLPKSPDLQALVRESVLNRPRPIPRTPETARLLNSHGAFQRIGPHRRSMSCSSITPKKSILHTPAPGSPSQLPPLPPIPADSDASSWQPPNDTKSMTFEEKMDMFYPESRSSVSSASRSTRRRSTSMPEMPVNSEFLSIPLPLASNSSPEDKKGIQTERSTITSVRTHSILNLGDSVERPGMSRSTTKSGTGVVLDDPGKHQKSLGGSPSGIQAPSSVKVEQEPSVPSRSELNGSGAAVEESTHDAGVTNSAEPVKPRADESTVSKPQSTEALQPNGGSQPEIGRDSHESGEKPAQGNMDGQPTPVVHDSSVGNVTKGSSQNDAFNESWHRRIGQNCPTFSNRRGTVRSRRGPPPTPLLLNQPTKTILVQAEPSPLESPDHALGMIEEQLQKLERCSYTSSVAEQQRMTLIGDLEKEMGLQENHWQNMRHTIVRDSLSTVHMSPQQPDELPGQQPSLWSKIRESRRSGLLAEPSKLSEQSSSSASTRKNEAGNSNSLPRLSNPNSRMSLLTVSRSSTAQMGSPTPPDTDESDTREEIEIPMVYSETMDMPRHSSPSLWRVKVPSPIISKHTPSLWSPTMTASASSPEPPRPPMPTSRPGTERPLEPLRIESTQLWSLDNKPRKPTPPGLWGSSSAPAPEDRPRRPKSLAQKPVRKSKRMTVLPDILESPEPLPDKRGTLGIFKFPWGEKSDTGTIPPPSFNFGAMPGTMTSGRALINPAYAVAASNVGIHQQQQQPSFFDEHDEEDIGDNFSDFDSGEDEDDFDETTLWEIARLLQSDKTTPREDITLGEWRHGNQRTSVVASPTESVESPHHAAIPMVLDVKPLETTKERPASLWEGKSSFFQVEKSKGLPQPDKKTWGSYLDAASGSPKALKRSATTGSISSKQLWSAPHVKEVTSQSLLWGPQTDSSQAKEPPAPSLTRLARLRTTEADWDAALAEAVNASGPVQPSHTTPEAHRPQDESAPPQEDTTPPSKDSLWSRPASQPVLPQTDPMWQPLNPQMPPTGSKDQAVPRYDRRSDIPARDPFLADFTNQALWGRAKSVSGQEHQQDWLSKMKRQEKQRSFDADVEMVQKFLDRRWGGL